MRGNQHHIKKSVVTCMVLVAVLLGLQFKMGAALATSPRGSHSWKQVGTDNFGTGYNALTAVTTISSTDAWAVGDYQQGPLLLTGTLHWDGSHFSHVDNPVLGNGNNSFYGVSAVSSTDVWAVGAYSQNPDSSYYTLTEHWDGSQWNIVPSPNPNADDAFFAVTAISSGDVWAVGEDSGGLKTLIERWNGTQWLDFYPPVDGYFYGVSADSSKDVWAVGRHGNTPIIDHWNGKAWNIVPNPGSSPLYAVTALSSKDVWAVGKNLIEHWDGVSWSVVPGAGSATLVAVTALSSNNVWAAGSICCEPANYAPVIEHWDGTQWSVSFSPGSRKHAGDSFAGIAGVPHTQNVFAVGQHLNNDTLAYEYA